MCERATRLLEECARDTSEHEVCDVFGPRFYDAWRLVVPRSCFVESAVHSAMSADVAREARRLSGAGADVGRLRDMATTVHDGQGRAFEAKPAQAVLALGILGSSSISALASPPGSGARSAAALAAAHLVGAGWPEVQAAFRANGCGRVARVAIFATSAETDESWRRRIAPSVSRVLDARQFRLHCTASAQGDAPLDEPVAAVLRPTALRRHFKDFAACFGIAFLCVEDAARDLEKLPTGRRPHGPTIYRSLAMSEDFGRLLEGRRIVNVGRGNYVRSSMLFSDPHACPAERARWARDVAWRMVLPCVQLRACRLLRGEFEVLNIHAAPTFWAGFERPDPRSVAELGGAPLDRLPQAGGTLPFRDAMRQLELSLTHGDAIVEAVERRAPAACLCCGASAPRERMCVRMATGCFVCARCASGPDPPVPETERLAMLSSLRGTLSTNAALNWALSDAMGRGHRRIALIGAEIGACPATAYTGEPGT